MAARTSRTSLAFVATRSPLSSRIQAIPQVRVSVTSSKLTQNPFKIPHIPARRKFHTSPSYSSTSHPTPLKYSYHIAASFTAKDGPYCEDKNTYNFQPLHPIPTPVDARDKCKRRDSGQDAFFVSRIGESNDVALGVCDGVGGWVSSGVDPADFSHGICAYMGEAAQEPPSRFKKHGEWTPRALMERGYDDITQDPRVGAGGSTACVAIAKSSGDLEVANLGDSGFLVVRLNAIHASSPPQTHGFNIPYQLSLVPAALRAQDAAFGGFHFQDMPRDADVTKHELRHGDVVVLATDGVWDNLYPGIILEAISQHMFHAKAWERTSDGIRVGEHLAACTKGPDESTDGRFSRSSSPSLQRELASSIAFKAKELSLNKTQNGPFAQEVQKHFPHEGWRGGKVDDICVVVMIAVEEGR